MKILYRRYRCRRALMDDAAAEWEDFWVSQKDDYEK